MIARNCFVASSLADSGDVLRKSPELLTAADLVDELTARFRTASARRLGTRVSGRSGHAATGATVPRNVSHMVSRSSQELHRWTCSSRIVIASCTPVGAWCYEASVRPRVWPEGGGCALSGLAKLPAHH
jgi:hypothetical protein